MSTQPIAAAASSGTRYADDAALSRRLGELWDMQSREPDGVGPLLVHAIGDAEAMRDHRGLFWSRLMRALFTYRERLIDDCWEDHRAAVALAHSLDDPRASRLLVICEAALLLQSGNAKDAHRLYNELPLLSSAQRDDPDDFFVLHGRAVCATSLGNMEEAFRADYANLQLTERLGPPLRHCISAAHLAGWLCHIDRASEGVELLAHPFREWVDPTRHRLVWTVALHNLALCQHLSGHDDEAYAGFRQLLDADVPTRFPAFAFNVYENLAEISIALGRLDEASAYLERAYAEAAKGNHDARLGACHFHAGCIEHRRGNPEAAIEHLTQAQTCLGKDPDLGVQSATRGAVHRLLATCQAELGRFDEAYAAHQRYFDAYRARADYVAQGQLAALQVKYGLTMALHRLEAERAFAIARERQLQSQARRDGLTGLFNRRYLDETLPELLNIARRGHHALAVAMIDLDFFKRVNDTFGHAGGDAVLRAFAQVVETGVRESDTACRYGGEEFCIVMLHCHRADAVHRLQALLQAFKATRVQDGAQSIEGLSFSCGVAMFPHDGDGSAALLDAADRRLYAAKAAGRGRVLADD